MVELFQAGVQLHAAGGSHASGQPHFTGCGDGHAGIGTSRDGYGSAALHLEGDACQDRAARFDTEITAAANFKLTSAAGDSKDTAFSLQEGCAGGHLQARTSTGRFHGRCVQNAASAGHRDQTAGVQGFNH